MTPEASGSRKSRFDEAWVAEVGQRLAANLRVVRSFGEGGRVHVERQLPFLVVYRRPVYGSDPGTAQLVTSTAAWLSAPDLKRHHKRLRQLVATWRDAMTAAFGATLILELWSGPVGGDDRPPPDPAAPAFRIFAPRKGTLDRTAQTLAEALGKISIHRRKAVVEVVYSTRRCPPGLPSWLTTAEARSTNCSVLGLEVRPVYVDDETGELFPLVHRHLRRVLGRALHKTFFEFARRQTTQRPDHYHELGRRALSRTVLAVDGRLAGVGEAFDFLLACTPVNTEEAWNMFRRRHYQVAPAFHYRALSVDPTTLKRELFAIPVEKIDDPALGAIFRAKQGELDRQLTLLGDRQTARFLPGSIALYGRVSDDLGELASQLLARLPAGSRDGAGRTADAQTFAAAAEQEIQHYRTVWPELPATVSVRKDLPAGLLVSRGRLLIGTGTRVPLGRIPALLQHEVGTHVVTYFNGRAQPLQQFALGLDGYDALQEGLAVLAEYLVGGLTRGRMRLLAARVVAARSVEQGAGFVDTFRLLHDQHGLQTRAAFGVAMRVHRAGGLTKDAIYLQGFRQALQVVQRGADLDQLYVGKMSSDQLGLVRELMRRRILHPPRLRPRFLELPEAVDRIDAIRGGRTLLDIATRPSR